MTFECFDLRAQLHDLGFCHANSVDEISVQSEIIEIIKRDQIDLLSIKRNAAKGCTQSICVKFPGFERGQINRKQPDNPVLVRFDLHWRAHTSTPALCLAR